MYNVKFGHRTWHFTPCRNFVRTKSQSTRSYLEARQSGRQTITTWGARLVEVTELPFCSWITKRTLAFLQEAVGLFFLVL